MGIRLKIDEFLSGDNAVVKLIAGSGITMSATELDHGDVEVTLTGAGGVGHEIATFAKAGTLTVGAGTGRFQMPSAGVIVGVGAAINTTPTGANLICDVNKNGTTMFTTQANRPTILANANATAASAVPDVVTFAAGDYLTVDIDQVGSTIAGADLVVQVTFALQ